MIDLLFVLILASMSSQAIEDEMSSDVAELLAEVDELQLEYDELVIQYDESLVKAQKKWNEKDSLKTTYESMSKSDTMREYQMGLFRIANAEWHVERNIHQDISDALDKLTVEFELVNTKLGIAQENLEKFLKAKQKKPEYQNVSITLSDSCIKLIENDFRTKCPTYYELFMLYDNMNPEISGEFAESPNDIRRVPSNYSTHLGFYDSFPNWILVMVDPDIEFMTDGKTANIEIQSRGFDVMHPFGYKTPYTGTMTFYEDVKISADCKQVIIAPDIDLINRVLVYVMGNCTGELDLEPNYRIHQPYAQPEWWESPALMYQEWLKKAKVTYGNLMGEYIP